MGSLAKRGLELNSQRWWGRMAAMTEALAEAAWPHRFLEEVPDRSTAIELAQATRAVLLGEGDPLAPLDQLEQRLRLAGIRVREARLLPDRGGAQALLIPLTDDRFEVPVDPTPARGWEDVALALRQDLSRHRRRFLVAHELAHSFFFSRGPGARPSRRRRASVAEEEFCDEFARWLLLPYAATRQARFSAASVFDLQRRFDVSVEVSARALAQAHSEQGWVALFVVDDREPSGARLQWASDQAPRGDAATLLSGICDCNCEGFAAGTGSHHLSRSVARALERVAEFEIEASSAPDVAFEAHRQQLVLVGNRWGRSGDGPAQLFSGLGDDSRSCERNSPSIDRATSL